MTARSIARLSTIVVLAALVLASASGVSGQTLTRDPIRETGASVTGAFEGWFRNPDGSFSLLFGYFNRNQKQELDIPIGPNNRIEPGGPDRGQPTHFLTGRQWGLFVIRVPSDFKGNRVTWTIVANGHTTSIPGTLNTDYEISPLKEAAVGNTPPVVRFEENGPSVQGPLAMTVERTAAVGAPLTLTVWPADDAKLTTGTGVRPGKLGVPVGLRWIKYRGPAGPVTFGKARPDVETLQGGEEGRPFRGKATTTATFGEPGEYELVLIATDYSGEGGGGFQCCWTTAHVKVSVRR